MPATKPSSTKSRENNENEASNNQSTDQINQSTDQNNRSSRQKNESSSQLPGDESSDLARSSIELALPWTTRDRIVNGLNQFSMLLFRKSASNEVKEHVVKQTNGLMTALIGLVSSETGDEQRSKERTEESKRIEESGGSTARKRKKGKKNAKENAKENAKNAQIVENSESNASRPFFLISLKQRSEIIDQLICNMDAVCYSRTCLDESSKSRLREQNNRLNIQLQGLPVKLLSISTPDESDPFDRVSTSLELTLDKFGQKLEQTAAASQCQSEQLATLSSELVGLRECVQKLETSVQRFEAASSEITMNYELIGVDAFFRTKGVRYSRQYTCNGCSWSIYLNAKEREVAGKVAPYLGFYLVCERLGDGNDRWTIRVSFDLLLLWPSNIVAKQTRHNCVFKESSSRLGVPHYSSYDELKNQNYITDDRLKLRVFLKCDPLA